MSVLRLALRSLPSNIGRSNSMMAILFPEVSVSAVPRVTLRGILAVFQGCRLGCDSRSFLNTMD